MRDLLTITRRELAAYCNSPIGAIFLIVFTLIASGLFVTQFFLFPVADLRGLFSTMPFILCVFIPAVTMRLWAEERASNTVEMLMTFPMRPMSLVLGKYLAALSFLLLALASTLVLPLMIMALGRPDLGQIASSYLGAVLMGAFFLAVGQLVSGFAKDQIVAFVLSLLVCFGLFLLGTDFVATALDGWIEGLGALLKELLGATEHYTVFTRGIVELTDVAYFVIWTLLCLFLNGLFLEGRGRKNFVSMFGLATVLCLALGLTFNGLAGDMTLGRFDWTEGRIHTISPASKRILAGLTSPVQVTYYVTPAADMPTEIKTLERDVEDRLEELRLASGGRMTFKLVHMHAANVLPGSSAQEAAGGLEQRMLEKGVEPFSVSAMRQTGSVSNLIYSSLGVAYKDKPEEIIPRIVPDTLGELEYYLVSTVFRLTREHDPVVAMLGGQEFQTLAQVLGQEKYDVRPTMLAPQSPLPQNADVYLFMQPADWNARQAWELQHLLATGHKVILAAQTSMWDYSVQQGQMNITRIPLNTGLDGMLGSLGLTLEQPVLMDTRSVPIRVATSQLDQLFGGGMSLNLPMQIMVTKDTMNADDPLTARLDNVFCMWGSALTLDEQKLAANSLNATVLMSSGPQSWLAPVQGALSQAQIQPGADQQSYPLMVRLSGQFPLPAATPPAWPANPQEQGSQPNAATPAEAPVDMSARPGELLVIGGSSMFGNDLIQHNIDVIMNAVDAMAHGTDLVQIRSKKVPDRIIVDLPPAVAAMWKIVTYCLPALFIAGLSLTNAWRRRRRRALYEEHLRSLS